MIGIGVNLWQTIARSLGPSSDPNLYFVLIVGQSNGTGNGGAIASFVGKQPANSSALTSSPTNYGYMLATGVIPTNVASAAPAFPDASLVPLTGIYEGLDAFNTPVHGESLATSLCRYLKGLNPTKNYAVANACHDGWAVSQINSGTTPYNNAKLYAQEFNQQAPILNAGGVAICLGVIYVGGEQDAQGQSAKTTVAAGSNGVAFPLVNATISAAAFTTGNTTAIQFPAANGSIMIQSTVGPQYITYATATGTSFTGCNGGTATGALGLSGGAMQTGGAIENANYSNLLKAFQASLVTDIATITGQNSTTYPIPIFFRQQFDYPPSANAMFGRTASQDYCILRDDIAANPSAANRKFWNFGAGYSNCGMSAVGNPGGLHINNGAQRQQGEMIGKVIQNVVYGGGNWDSVRPTAISRTGAVITLTVQTPFGVGFFDARTVKAFLNASNLPTWGFSYQDSSGAIAISSVSALIVGSTIVFTITLASDPSANTVRLLRAAWSGETASTNLSKINGARTNCFATSTAVSNYGYDLSDPMLSFEEGVP